MSFICLKYYKNMRLLSFCFLYFEKDGGAVENIDNDVAILKIATIMEKW